MGCGIRATAHEIDHSTNRHSTTRAYFEGGEQLTERQRLARFEKAWRELTQAFPNDLEARAFTPLRCVRLEMPNYPGAHHYIIHAYDSPELAESALVAANHYGEISSRVPHATHMMTHIYTRLGEWDKAHTSMSRSLILLGRWRSLIKEVRAFMKT